MFLTLGGGAYAATALPARSVGSRELKANAVTRVKIKNNAVNGSKVLDGSLRGADIRESSLGPVPSALSSAAIGRVRGHDGRLTALSSEAAPRARHPGAGRGWPGARSA